MTEQQMADILCSSNDERISMMLRMAYGGKYAPAESGKSFEALGVGELPKPKMVLPFDSPKAKL